VSEFLVQHDCVDGKVTGAFFRRLIGPVPSDWGLLTCLTSAVQSIVATFHPRVDPCDETAPVQCLAAGIAQKYVMNYPHQNLLLSQIIRTIETTVSGWLAWPFSLVLPRAGVALSSHLPTTDPGSDKETTMPTTKSATIIHVHGQTAQTSFCVRGRGFSFSSA
jgi:hypothetical protein